MGDGSIIFKGITKIFDGIKVLHDVSFEIKKGEFLSIVGPSGCGKTTLLRILAGFETPESGEIILDGVNITHVPANKRPINTVFQNYALFPHLTIWENIAFGLLIAKRPKSEIDSEVARMLALIQMSDQAQKKPDQISGGQKQRVAIARALVNHPQILLLDEPLAALDLKLRQKMLLDLDRIHDEVGITFVFVTHDQTEAMGVSDRIAVLHKGSLEQIGTPMQVYESPISSFVADFIGDTNIFDGQVIDLEQKDYARIHINNFPNILCFKDKQVSKGDSVHLSIRPEKIHISRERPAAHPLHNIFPCVVEDKIYKGDHTYFGVRTENLNISVTQQHSRFMLDETPIKWEENVWIWWHANDGFMLENSNKLEQPND